MGKRKEQPISLIFAFFAFIVFGALSFTPVHGSPEPLDPSLDDQIRSVDVMDRGAEFVDETAEDDANPTATTDECEVPIVTGLVSSSEKEAAPLRSASGFDVFNAGYGDRWRALFSEKTGKVKILYGALSKRYENGPESIAREFLRDSHMIFGLKQDLSDLSTLRVDKMPEWVDVSFQQTYNSVPIVGVFVLVHSTPQGQVTMVQNGYIQGFQVANAQVVSAEVAKNIAHNDLQANLRKGATLSDASAEELIAPHKEKYYYVWKIVISTENPPGYWVYHVDVQSGEILYRGNEIRSVKNGKGRAYTSNANYKLGKISNVTLKNMFSTGDGYGYAGGYLWGLHALIMDNNNNNPYAPDYKFLYDPVTQKDWFDATHAYYHMNAVWDWWHKNVILKYAPSPPDHFYNNPPAATFVNVDGICDRGAFYSPNIKSLGEPGFEFANERSCPPSYSNEDFVIDSTVVRHEFTHAMMDWCGFHSQFGNGPGVNGEGYGWAMDEGNADWFAFLYDPKTTLLGDVVGRARDLDNTQMYPYNVNEPGSNMPEEHYTGQIWGGYLYDLYRVLRKNALQYVYQSFSHFDRTGGWDSSNPDFFDGIWAQSVAEYIITGKQTSTLKAWGSMVSRGISGSWLIPPYCSSNYFNKGSSGCDNSQVLVWRFPRCKTIKTVGNLLQTNDLHDYPFQAIQPNSNLTATVTGTAGGLINPSPLLYTSGGVLLPAIITGSSTKATLTYHNLPAGNYVVRVTGDNTAPARGYYNFQITVNEAPCPTPGTPSSPSPSDGATGISTSPMLSWTATSNTNSYDVYFGTSSNPPLAGNTTNPNYPLSGLAPNTTYYWTVVAKNSCGNTTNGPTWSFTTSCSTPGTPSSPSPSDGATDVSTSPTLSWAATSNTNSYDVYFGTSTPPPLVGNVASPSYPLSGLNPGKLYYWKVVAKNDCGTTPGPVWSFSILPLSLGITSATCTQIPFDPLYGYLKIVVSGTASGPPGATVYLGIFPLALGECSAWTAQGVCSRGETEPSSTTWTTAMGGWAGTIMLNLSIVDNMYNPTQEVEQHPIVNCPNP